jgi:hypothetical protein
MKYDLELVVPVSLKYEYRIEDFKKYGIFNVKNRRVLVTMLTTGDEIEDSGGWPEGVESRIIHNNNGHYVANIYKNFLDGDRDARWIMKLDDDSSTDIDGMLFNLDRLYDHEEKYYLATSPTEFGHISAQGPVMHGAEEELKHLYEPIFGDIFVEMHHEIESCVISNAGLRHILSNEKARKFLEKRCKYMNGVGDTALAFASIISKLHPLNLPFSTNLPLINRFSPFGGNLNHIHLVSREPEGDNFSWERCGKIQYEALARAIEGTKTEKENAVSGKKFILETEQELTLYEFKENRTARIKFDEETYIWLEYEDEIVLCRNGNEIHRKFKIAENGDLREIQENGLHGVVLTRWN